MLRRDAKEGQRLTTDFTDQPGFAWMRNLGCLLLEFSFWSGHLSEIDVCDWRGALLPQNADGYGNCSAGTDGNKSQSRASALILIHSVGEQQTDSDAEGNAGTGNQ